MKASTLLQPGPGSLAVGDAGTLWRNAWITALGFAVYGFTAGVWATIFLLVGLQLTTTLRPILGRSDRLFTPEKRFFLEHWGDNLDRTLGQATSPRRGRSAEDDAE